MSKPQLLSNIRRIAVIGAGPIGLAATKYLLAEKHFSVVDVYEQQAAVGGVWLRTEPFTEEFFSVPQTSHAHPLQKPQWTGSASDKVPIFMTPMYDSLETNIPKELMQFSDLPFPDEWQLFPTRQNVLEYIERYAEDVKHLVKFQAQVVDVKRDTSAQGNWDVTVQDLRTDELSSKRYDAIAVCSGHYTVPNIPPLKGIERFNAAYPGSIKHSKWYRDTTPFTGRKVLIVGNAASGIDISTQIARVSKPPLLLSQRGASMFSDTDKKDDETHIKILPNIEEFIDPAEKERTVRFVNGHVESGIDTILFATGYRFSFPFLRSAELHILDDGMRVRHVYQHFLHAACPSIAFLGLPIKILPFPLGEAQAAVMARIWSGRLPVPSSVEMERWEKTTATENGDGKGFHTLYFPKDFSYQQALCDWADQASGEGGKNPPRFDGRAAWIRERFPAIRQAFSAQGSRRSSVRTLKQIGYDYEDRA